MFLFNPATKVVHIVPDAYPDTIKRCLSEGHMAVPSLDWRPPEEVVAALGPAGSADEQARAAEELAAAQYAAHQATRKAKAQHGA